MLKRIDAHHLPLPINPFQTITMKILSIRTLACPCATRRTSIYKGLATLPYKCSRNCQ